MQNNISPCIIVIFGGTGDLTLRKLIPALYNLAHEGNLPDKFAIVGISRKSMSNQNYRNKFMPSIEKFSRYSFNQKVWDTFSNNIYFYSLDVNDEQAYLPFKDFLANIDESYGINGNRLFYLSVSPSNFKTIAENLKKQAMTENIGAWQRVVIEKPFGQNLDTAKYLNNVISNVFSDENIFRIDHYLGKEMLQNLLVIRFGNAMFERIWNNKHIDNIQITSSEIVGVENRAEYYDTSGALKDMFQNHMLQLLALLTMEQPKDLSAHSIQNEKSRLFNCIIKTENNLIQSEIVRGQYSEGFIKNKLIPAYRNEPGINPTSNTDTFIAVKLTANNPRWSGVPFYLRTGKRMSEKATYIVIEFKLSPESLYYNNPGMQPNNLIIKVQPEEGISFSFNTKIPGSGNEITSAKMDFCQNCAFENNSPESYERLIGDVLRNDHTLFTSWNEIEASWQLADKIYDIWQEETPLFPNYIPSSWGPALADELLKKNNHHWWNL
jgi:glucose-6-phosphate 1-dehydrogenase